MRAFPRERFISHITLTPAMVSAYASAAGDTNPVHHDTTFAAATRYGRPIYADETIRLEWLVVKVTPNRKLDGDVVELRGRVQNQQGHTAMGAKGRVLVTDRL